MVEYKRVVLKFGGSVIADINAIGRVANVIKNISEKYKVMAVVVSAMGKTTDNLDRLAHNIAPTPDKRELDALLATGEMQSAALLAMWLNAIGVSARSYNAWQRGIITDDNFGNARIECINSMLMSPYCGIPIVTGFQGITENGDITTLGREGSDISAVAIAHVSCADFCWFFKDGGGIYDKNPKNNFGAKMYDFMTYDEALGVIRAKQHYVLHPNCIEYGKKKYVPLFVSEFKSDFMPSEKAPLPLGTWIEKQKSCIPIR